MNERIRELMIEAGYAAPELASRANKLAELLVKECTDICEHWDKTTNYTSHGQIIADKIKKQFGVEE